LIEKLGVIKVGSSLLMHTNSVDRFFDQLTHTEKKYAPKRDSIFYEGNDALLNLGVKVSVVGSRKVSEDGIKRTKQLVKLLVSNNVIVVSGLAQGVDTVAHKEAISNGGNTIAVLGTPLDQCYPAQNKSLLEEIKTNHLAISQFPIGSKTYKSNFPQRNRTMALLSDATIIVEAGAKSGTMHQGWEALRLGRKLYILKSLADKDYSWINELIKYGAEVLTSDNIEFAIESIPFYTQEFDLNKWF